MENNIKKTIDDIDVPLEKLDRVIEKGMQTKKKKRKNPIVMAMISVVATVALILSSGFISPQIAKVLAAVPLIGFMYDIEEHDKGLYTALSDANKVMLNETVTSNGIAITVEEVVYDGARLNVIFSMPNYESLHPLLYIDGKYTHLGGGARILEEKGVFRGLWEFRMEEELPDAFDLTIKINQIGSTKGEWVFSTPIQKVNNKKRTLVAGQKGKVDGISFSVESVETSTTTTKVKVKFDSLYEKLFSEEGVLHETITDQNGTPLTVLDKSGSDDDKDTTWTYLMEPFSEDITELKIFYYFFPWYLEQKKILVPLADIFPQRIPQGKMGDIVITDVAHKGSKASLSLTVDSDFPFDDTLTPIFFEINNDEGESLITDYIHAVGPNEYQLTFQSDAGKPNIHTLAIPNMEVEQSAIVTIPIK